MTTSHDYLLGLPPLFDIGKENNIPAYFSTFLLLGCAYLSAVIAFLKRKTSVTYFPHWIGLIFIFLYMAIDELLMIHEKTADIFFAVPTDMNRFIWIIPYAILVLSLIPPYFRFLQHLPDKVCRLCVIGAVLYITGVLGCETLEAWLNHAGKTNHKILHLISISCEELLEMLGMSFAVYGLLLYKETLLNKIQTSSQRLL
jgi:hypothetical protein